MVPDLTIADAAIAFAPWLEPTAAELDAIEAEMPLIAAEIDLLDVQITTLDRVPSELDGQRVRRVRRRALAARRDLANRTTTTAWAGGAA
ncbi:hypothetical protein FQU76_14500 [Streptomyces qinzhouensis]|uniref:Uncharacterized protein n=1 Tax=Streptomyces qinzhouensis TaxID=2599401 RepID=A0A5B8ITH0_9ACTN|nr:DUF6284 family protein [Streptomyces qinzhouensis]QDY81029.1 hypothetical protein FQU76_14500 [Streptomyces qinzhouensis]